MAKYAPKIGADVQLVIPAHGDKDQLVFAAKITQVSENGVALTYFPPGGGAHGIVDVPHVNETSTEDAAHYRTVR